MLAATDSNTLVTVFVAVIGAGGTAFSAWLYSRHGQTSMTPEGRRVRVKDRIIVDIPPDPLDIETFHQLLKRLRRLERWRRHVMPLLHKVANTLDWDDPELYPATADEEEDD